MRQLRQWLYRKKLQVIPALAFAMVVIFLAGRNVDPGAWLSGWDTLHPEFNFPLNIRRSIFAVWQEYQGLGLLGGMGHAADLPRQLILWLWSAVVPTHLLRYAWTFFMLWLGPVGVYWLLKETLFRRENFERARLAAFLGGLFYLLNLATVQMFFVPFEAFTTHYGFLPWLFWSVVRYVRQPSGKRLALVVGLHVLASAQAYVPTVFVVYSVALLLFLLGWVIERKSFFPWKRLWGVGWGIFVASAFWLLPFSYFVRRNVTAPVEAHTNWMFTENTYLQNRVYGRLSDVLRLKSFWFDYVELASDGSLNYLLAEWRDHLARPVVAILGWVVVAMVLFGLVSLVRGKRQYRWPFLLLFVFSLAMLGTATFPFSWLNEVLRSRLVLFSQVFRASFTKFSILLGLVMSAFFAVASGRVMRFTKWKKLRIWQWGMSGVLALVLGVYALPAFQGEAFFDRVQVRIPHDYFALMDFFDRPGNEGRIANFPQHTFVGWKSYDWGLVGSGFEWYGVSQPMLDRAFDVWSSKNENYYWEMSRALYADDPELLLAIFDKYRVRWVMIDENINDVGSPKKLYVERLKQLLAEMPEVLFRKQFGEIRVYEVNVEDAGEWVYLLSYPQNVGPVYEWTGYDQAYLEHGDYISIDQEKVAVYYPFRSLFTGRSPEERGFQVAETDGRLLLMASIPKTLGERFGLSRSSAEITDEVSLFSEGLSAEVESFTGQVTVTIPKLVEDFGLGKEVVLAALGKEAQSCNRFNTGIFSQEVEVVGEKKTLLFRSLRSSNCLVLDFPELSQRYGYLISVESQHARGKSMWFQVTNLTSGRVDLETQLLENPLLKKAYFVLPPSNYYGLGYRLTFDNISIGNVESVNRLGTVAVYPIPQRYLESLKLEPEQPSVIVPSGEKVLGLTVEHPNESWYRVRFSKSPVEGATLVLSQGFDDGWLAYEKRGGLNYRKLDDHVLVNNWANGWTVPEGAKEIVIFYWPQLLEFVGFGMLLAGGFWLVRNVGKENSKT